MSEITYESIHVVGGGANAAYLNELTAKATGKTVYAGPTEATAIGNLTAQIIAAGELENLQAARKCIFESFEIKKYEKQQSGISEKIYAGSGCCARQKGEVKIL